MIRTEAAINYAVSMSCIMGCRLCLNVRGMVWHDDDISLSHPAGAGRSQAQRASARWPVIVFADEDAAARSGLSEYEMDELRSMKQRP